MKKTKKERTYLLESDQGWLPQIDFSDTISTTNHLDNLEVIANKILGQFPRGIRWLFDLRNRLVSVFGLKTDIPKDYHVRYEKGGYIGFFQIYDIQPDQLVMGADDKHLNFRALLYRTQDSEFNIKMTTLVQYNNRFGKIYMSLIAPFHVLVVKKMVAQAFVAKE
ncbi:DUF2867 domain-containing protein [Sediminicola luteus]|uniref:DUF2867 domain-containing protein n=1 Tax=Sediminicola luteus TaxID=319238 RepID=A0A2A4G8Y5_9FLAO|nr:DUF2867 domain-containing protein [Sediminicola luteus]PCE64232.1 hypothetical protein B7P33_07980 [Sediminicola luteus]